jgi:hypothetical protein
MNWVVFRQNKIVKYIITGYAKGNIIGGSIGSIVMFYLNHPYIGGCFLACALLGVAVYKQNKYEQE